MATFRIKLAAAHLVAAALLTGSCVSAQSGGMAQQRNQMEAAALPRFKLAEQALTVLRDQRAKGEMDAIHANIATFKAAEAQAKKRYESGGATALDYLEAQYLRVQAEKLIPPQMGGGMGGAGGMGGGFGGGSDASPAPRPRKPHPADAERNKAIEQKLEKPVKMDFASETPLEDVIRYIKDQTKEPGGKVIPIYVDPVGLQEAEKTLTSPITLELEDVPLRTTFRLLLAQLGLDYRVRDGMLYINSQSGFDEEEEATANEALQEIVRQRGVGQTGMGGWGGMGGMGGGMGGMGGGMR
jgi:hypothetical protein